MLIVNEHVADYFGQVMANVARMGPGALSDLLEQLSYLDTYGCNSEFGLNRNITNCFLRKDFAPNSFSFTMMRATTDGSETYKYWFDGGLIYSGPGLPSDGSSPSLSVSLDPYAASGSKHMWSVHT